MPGISIGVGLRRFAGVKKFSPPAGLLDTFSGAAAAYSLERLAADTSSVVRVRRSSDDTEQDFTAAEVSGGTLTTFTGAGDGFVTTWYDQSGNARDAEQATAASQPQIVSAGALVTNSTGRPTIRGTATSTLDMPTGFNVRSVFGIAQFEATVESFGGWGAFSSTETPARNIRKSSDSQPAYRRNLSNEFIQNASGIIRVNGVVTETFANGDAHLATLIRDSAVTTGNSPILFGGDTARRFNGGKLSVAILYPDDQSANRAAIEAQLAEIYGITLA